MKEKDFKRAAFDLCRTTERYAIMRSGLFQIESKLNCQDTCSNGGKCEEICGEKGYCCSNESGNCPRGKSNIKHIVFKNSIKSYFECFRCSSRNQKNE